MKKKDDRKPYPEVEDINPKSDYRDQFKRKKETQKSAKERRQFIRELKEDRDWN
jgi:hypothetical protein